MIKYDELYKIVESKLSTSRFKHTIGVVNRAIEYANIYGIDKEKIKLTALAHDIAKELTEEEKREYYKYFDEIEKINSNLHHAKIGAIICKQYGFTEDMINAIKYHTTGRENMTTIEKIIYLADATEEGRTIGKTYAELIKEDIDKGMLEICLFTLNKLIEQKVVIHLDSVKCYNYYNILCKEKER